MLKQKNIVPGVIKQNYLQIPMPATSDITIYFKYS